MPTQTTDSSLAQAIAQTEAELVTLQARLTDLRKPPTPPPATAGTDEIIAASLKAAQAAATAAPTASGLELAIARLQGRLVEQRAALQAAQAADTKAAHEAAVAVAQAELRELGGQLAAKAAEIEALIREMQEVAAGPGGESFKALQSRPAPNPVGASWTNYNPWRPKSICTIGDLFNLPKFIERPDGFAIGWQSIEPHKKPKQ
jgi:hypothetical protein